MTGAQCCFDAKNSIHGFEEFLPLSKLLYTHERFMVNYRRIVLAEIHVLPDIVVPKEPVKVIEPLSCKVGNHIAEASANIAEGDSSCQVVQTTVNVSKENVHVDAAAASEELLLHLRSCQMLMMELLIMMMMMMMELRRVRMMMITRLKKPQMMLMHP